MRAWGRLLDVWKVLDDAERTELLGSVVVRAEALSNEKMAVELLPVPEPPSEVFRLSFNMGAGVGLEPTTFGL
jgi:hypothetical protein